MASLTRCYDDSSRTNAVSRVGLGRVLLAFSSGQAPRPIARHQNDSTPGFSGPNEAKRGQAGPHEGRWPDRYTAQWIGTQNSATFEFEVLPGSNPMVTRRLLPLARDGWSIGMLPGPKLKLQPGKNGGDGRADRPAGQ